MCSADLKPGTTAQRRKRSVPATRLPQAPHKKEPRASVERLDARITQLSEGLIPWSLAAAALSAANVANDSPAKRKHGADGQSVDCLKDDCQL
jgi:hypothetical protein